MGWTNSVPIFHEDVTYILQPGIPHTTIPYIDDVPIRGPATHYLTEDRLHEMHLDNSDIRHFVWEHFQGLNRVEQCMKYCSGMFSGYKAILCTEEITVVGHRCTPEGRIACCISIKLGPLHRCLRHPHIPWHHRSLPHVHLKLRALRKPSHHVNSQEPVIRLRTRADIRTGRPLTSLNRVTCTLTDRLHFDFFSDPCGRHFTNSHRIPSLPMFA